MAILFVRQTGISNSPEKATASDSNTAKHDLDPRHERLCASIVHASPLSPTPAGRLSRPPLSPVSLVCVEFEMSLIIAIFALVFVTELISWIGKSVLLDLVYSVYLRIFYSAKMSQQKKLKSEILTTKKELLQTSAQDHFAKWAKLRRSVDKGLADLEKLNGELSATRTGFSLKFNSFLWICTSGLQFVVGWWYRKSAVFFLPPGWFGPLTWWLSFPFAPAGSVSCGVWQMACRRVIKVGERVVKELMTVSSETETASAVPSEKTSDSDKKST